MAEPRYGRIRLRPTVAGPEYVQAPHQSPPGRSGYYSDDDRYAWAPKSEAPKEPRMISVPQIPSPPPIRRRKSAGNLTEPLHLLHIHAGENQGPGGYELPIEGRVPLSRFNRRKKEMLVQELEEDEDSDSDEMIEELAPVTQSRMRKRPNHRTLAPPVQTPPPVGRRKTPNAHRKALQPRTPDFSHPDSDPGLLAPPYIGQKWPPASEASSKVYRAKSERAPTTQSGWTKRSPFNPPPLNDGPYQYRPLDDTYIRLVRILPERKTMIKCEIIHVSLEYPPRYAAISYAWGDARDTRKIEIEGCPTLVSVSLHSALQVLRQKTDPVLVWVDALSIDQQNKDERTEQIRLMPSIYSYAESVAVWLGSEADNSTQAVDYLGQIANMAKYPDRMAYLLTSGAKNGDLMNVVSLFRREYWRRLWIVQEVFNARKITVYCGPTKAPWDWYKLASEAFGRHRNSLSFQSDETKRQHPNMSQDHLGDDQVLIYQGPASLPDMEAYMDDGEEAVLEILRLCRRKLTSDPRDKVFGILGVLPEEIQSEFHADYSLSVKDVYTEVVDYLLNTTQRLDVICEAIHFPTHTNSTNLPSFVPDWSHIPQTSSLGHKYNFSASGSTKARCQFLDERLNKLEIAAIPLDTIKSKGVAVGTLCNLGDYLMAFLNWRALLLGNFSNQSDEFLDAIEDAFAATLCLGQVPSSYDAGQWVTVCYALFAHLLRQRLPYLPLDQELQKCLSSYIDIKPEARRDYVQKHFGNKMMGRSFCITHDNRVGMGSGFMLPEDQIVVPLGCSTPILLRPEGTRGEYRFVGDVYIHGYMSGKAVEHLQAGKRVMKKYVLH